MAERVGQFLGNYQLLRLLGRGAFAEVYLAEHRYLEVPAAIKVLHVRMESDTHVQFLREARTIAHLQHAHIVRVLDFGFQEQTPFLVMEYTPNGTLRIRHPKGTRLSLEQIVHYVKQIAPALDYAHQQHVIHRDVKPENMLLSANDEVVLSDFGLAVIQCSLDSFSTQNPSGTPQYMAPEQIRGKPTAASDQYALGVLVYEWLCGEPPFGGALFEVLSQHLHQPPPSLCVRIPSLPQAIEDAVFGALAKEPQGRFSSVQDFADVLEEAIDAIQPLSLGLHAEHLTREQTSPFATLPSPLDAPSPKQENRFSSSTQPPALTNQRAEETEALVELEMLAPATQTHASSQHERVRVSRTNRQRLLRKVHAFWIAGVFEHSLHGAALLSLGLQEQPDAVANPWQLVLQHPAGVPLPLPAGTRIKEVYDAAEGELLILGAPGSGKTTLLLELARDLLNRAEYDEQHPLPVVFNLASWASKQQPLADWLVEELNSTYQVPRKLGQTWVDGDQILPLLDGLDEVAPNERTQCIEAINTYRGEHGLLPLVVCSRSADYLAPSARIRLGSAVAVQPLTEQQVDDYLARGGEPLRALRAALQQDAALCELTNTPLMLSILTLTYHGMPVEDLVQEASLSDHQRQIFEHYVQRMLRLRGMRLSYTPEQTTHWLSWLARQMKQQNQTVFYIEHLQPTWLSGERMRRAYDWWAVRFPAILIGILVSLMINSALFLSGDVFPLALTLAPIYVLGGFLGWLLSAGSSTRQEHWSSGKTSRGFWFRLVARLRAGILLGLSGALLLGGLFGLLFGDLFGVLFGLLFGGHFGLLFGPLFWLSGMFLQAALQKSLTTASSLQVPQRSRKSRWQRLLKRNPGSNAILVGLLLGQLSGLLFGGLSSGLRVGFISGLLSVLLLGKPGGISLTDELVWSWRSLRQSLFTKTHLRITLGLSGALFLGQLSGLLSGGLNLVLSVGLSYWLLFGLIQGVSGETIGDHRRVVPNQGVRSSARNSLVLGLISTAIAWLITGLGFVLSYGLSKGLGFGLSDGLLIGLSAGLLAGLFNGGIACLRHGVVRFLLWRAGAIPWNYPRFLDYASERTLLSKVGGGYIFVHRLLLEYFAALESSPTPDEVKPQKERVLPIS